MGNTKMEQMTQTQQEIQQLKNRGNLLLQQHKGLERKARTRRFCTRAGYIESVLPETATLTDEQFRALINRTLLTGQGRSILDSIIAAPCGADGSKTGETARVTG
jgi:hypothetical protein